MHYNQMTPEQQRQYKIEAFGYDPTIKEKFLGSAIIVDWRDGPAWFDFYLKANNRIDICHQGCNGNLMSGSFDPETKIVQLPSPFITAFLSLLENYKNGGSPPKRPQSEIDAEVAKMMASI